MRLLPTIGISFLVLVMGCSGSAPESRATDTPTAAVETSADGPRCAVLPSEPGFAEISIEHGGNTYYFCCSSCKGSFVAQPEKYVRAERNRSEE